MPKRPYRDKQTIRPAAKPRTVGDLLSSRLPALSQSASPSPESSEWHITVMKALGPELDVKVSRISLNSGKITVIAESSAWATRIRFQLADLEPILRDKDPSIREIVVRVRPARTAAKA